MVEVTCFSGASNGVLKVAVDATALGDVVRKRLIRHAYLHYTAAHRAGTHKTKTRAEVNFNTRKPWRQKGTGRARAGDFSSPIWRKGGIAHGPKPRSYTSGLPRRMRIEALRSAMLGKVQGDQLRLVEGLKFAAPKTKDAIAILGHLGVGNSKALFVTGETDGNVIRSFRNLKSVEIARASDLNVEHLLRNPLVVMDRSALDLVMARIGNA